MCLALKFSKHRLAVNGPLEVLEVLVQQIEAGLGVILVLEQLSMSRFSLTVEATSATKRV